MRMHLKTLENEKSYSYDFERSLTQERIIKLVVLVVIVLRTRRNKMMFKLF